jgi:hypothetical protein
MPLSRRSVVGFPLWRSGFEPGLVLMGFVDVSNINVRRSWCKCPIFCPVLTKFRRPQQIAMKVSNSTFQSNASSESRVDSMRTERRTDRHDEAEMLVRDLWLIKWHRDVVLLRIFRFSPISYHSANAVHTYVLFIHHRRFVILATDSVVK